MCVEASLAMAASNVIEVHQIGSDNDPQNITCADSGHCYGKMTILEKDQTIGTIEIEAWIRSRTLYARFDMDGAPLYVGTEAVFSKPIGSSGITRGTIPLRTTPTAIMQHPVIRSPDGIVADMEFILQSAR